MPPYAIPRVRIERTGTELTSGTAEEQLDWLAAKVGHSTRHLESLRLASVIASMTRFGIGPLDTGYDITHAYFGFHSIDKVDKLKSNWYERDAQSKILGDSFDSQSTGNTRSTTRLVC